MTVITYNEKGEEVKETGVKLPPNGLIYVTADRLLLVAFRF